MLFLYMSGEMLTPTTTNVQLKRQKQKRKAYMKSFLRSLSKISQYFTVYQSFLS